MDRVSSRNMKVEIDSSHTLTADQNIGSVLRQLASSQSTGCLEVTGNNIKWSVFLQFGKLLGIDCSVPSLGSLIYRLRQCGCDAAAKAVNTLAVSGKYSPSENFIQQEIDRLVLEDLLDLTLGIQISTDVTKEILESLLWLETGTYQWREKELGTRLAIKNPEYRLDLAKLIAYYHQRLVIWQNHITIVQSPHQRPYLMNEQLLDKPVVAGTLSSKALRQIAQFMRGVSLRELSLLLKQDELKVIQILIPYLRENVISLREPSAACQQLPQVPELNLTNALAGDEVATLDLNARAIGGKTKTYKIACIDDSPLVLNELERFLQTNSSYLLTKIEDPIKASSLIFRLKPDLILMDITMPNINGYQLCYLFRNSATLKDTPIIIVTGNKGLIDKARAKIVGATDYLTKPFTEADLLGLVEKYLAKE